MTKANEGYDYFSTFPQRFSSLMLSQNVTQKTIAEVCGVQRQSVSGWMNGNTRPDILSLVEIAKYFNVSTDYLLGLTDYKTDSKATRELCSTLGLSEEAVKILSADDTSTIAKQWKALVPTEQSDYLGGVSEDDDETAEETLRLLFDDIADNVSFVFNRLIEEMIDTQTFNMEHDEEDYFMPEKSLIDCLTDFYDCSYTEGFRTYTNEQEIILPAEALLTARTKYGRTHLRPKSVRELIVDASIDRISARLQHIKKRELLKKEQ